MDSMLHGPELKARLKELMPDPRPEDEAPHSTTTIAFIRAMLTILDEGKTTRADCVGILIDCLQEVNLGKIVLESMVLRGQIPADIAKRALAIRLEDLQSIVKAGKSLDDLKVDPKKVN